MNTPDHELRQQASALLAEALVERRIYPSPAIVTLTAEQYLAILAEPDAVAT